MEEDRQKAVLSLWSLPSIDRPQTSGEKRKKKIISPLATLIFPFSSPKRVFFLKIANLQKKGLCSSLC